MEEEAAPLSRKRKIDEVGSHPFGRDAALDVDLNEDEINRLVDEAPEIPELDEKELTQLVLKFERCVTKNLELRTKHHDDPQKFMDSEIALDESITALQAVAAQPSLYPELVRLKTLDSLFSVLGHENVDVALSVVSVLHELTEPDVLAEDAKTDVLVSQLLQGEMLAILVNSLDRFDETQEEEQQGVHKIMGIFENLAPMAIPVTINKTNLVDWLIKRIVRTNYEDNVLYASEILSILLQANGDEPTAAVCQTKFREKDGFSSLLKVVKQYATKDVDSTEEHEFVENVLSTLCFAVNGNAENRTALAKAEGLPLLIQCLKKRRATYGGALKLLNYSLQDDPSNCFAFVEEGGLKVLFAAFMAKGKLNKKYGFTEEEREEHSVSIIAHLFMNIADIPLLRLLHKFEENNYEKIERLVELHEKYFERLERADKEYRQADPDVAEDDPMFLITRIDAGLFTLQFVSAVIAFTCTAQNPGMKDHLETMLNQKDSSLVTVKKTLQGYADQIDDDKKRLKDIVQALVRLMARES